MIRLDQHSMILKKKRLKGPFDPESGDVHLTGGE